MIKLKKINGWEIEKIEEKFDMSKFTACKTKVYSVLFSLHLK